MQTTFYNQNYDCIRLKIESEYTREMNIFIHALLLALWPLFLVNAYSEMPSAQGESIAWESVEIDELPQTTVINEATKVSIFNKSGAVIGSMSIRSGSEVQVGGRQGNQLEIIFSGAKHLIDPQKTSILNQVKEYRIQKAEKARIEAELEAKNRITIEQACTPIPISEWVGNKFIFIPLNKYAQKKGYLISDFTYIPYEKYLGKTITAVKHEKSKELSSKEEVHFKVDETGEEIVLPVVLNNVDGIVLKRDYDYAQKELLGKTLWLKNREARSVDPNSNESSIRVKNLQPVTVTGVELDEEESWPIRFYLKSADGQEFSKVSKISGTNSERTHANDYKFLDVFFLEDPRKTFNWDEGIFQAIERGALLIGMTKEQAILSRGRPLKVNSTISKYGSREQWVYPLNEYVYFEGDKLTTVQH